MKSLTFALQLAWLLVSVGPLLFSILLRRVSLQFADANIDPRTQRYFTAKGKAWEGNAVEIVTSIVRGCAGFFLPEQPIVIVLLAIGLAGRLYQLVRLWQGYNAIVNGKG